MTTAAEWVAGARPRTLGAAVSPVLVGTAAAYADADTLTWWRAAAALVVALALQVGVNYANDYSDGVRGTDTQRAGPLRLTASGVAAPAAVRNAAAIAFGIAAVFGLALAIAVDLRLLLVGAVAIAAAVLYTGGPRPYGYSGLGELAVLVFFGFVATAGSAYVQVERVPAAAWWGAVAVGLLACAILLANNIRDADTDRAVGKRTLPVLVGVPAARALYTGCVTGAFLASIAVGVLFPTALIALAALPLAVRPVRLVVTRRDPPSLVAALVATARLELIVAVLLSLGLVTS
ncbi:MAG TPA: 1,4-dihydroxy-2-naphthoate polyprenyltransferase [Acidimicrobiia bacterium]|nr:1,4-dihydroxy-2-naphthoate polyprenyltransferase [Acidimicrobiia bacterium]